MSRPNYPWVTIAETKGSLRWWKKSGETGHMKGSIKLQRSTDTYNYRMAYDGHWAGNPQSAAWATLALPHSSAWEVDHSKFQSNNAKARAIRIAFCQEAGNKTGLVHLQITIPIDGDGKAEKQFVQAVLSAATV